MIYLFLLPGVMVSMLTSSVVDREFECFKIGICCFFPKHAALRSKSKEWLAQNLIYVSDWSDMSAC